MNFLRPAAVVLFALLVPGGLVVLVPMFYRVYAEARDRRSKAKSTAEFKT